MANITDPILELVAAVVEQAHADAHITRQNRRTKCVATFDEHPANQCAAEFLDWLKAFTNSHATVTAAEICLEVLDNGIRAGFGFSLSEGEGSKSTTWQGRVYDARLSGSVQE